MGKKSSSDVADDDEDETEIEKRYRLMGKRYRLMGKRYRLMGKRSDAADEDVEEENTLTSGLEEAGLSQLMDKRYRLMGKRYRLMGKRYRLMGKRSGEDNNEEVVADSIDQLHKRYRIAGKRYRLMG